MTRKSEKVFLICDIISSGMKTSLFSEGGERLAEAYRPLPIFLSGNRAEQPPEAWRTCLKETAAEVLGKYPGCVPSAVSFSAMSQVCLPVDEAGKPLGPAFTWSDSRAEEIPDPLAGRFSPEYLHRLTGFPDTANSSIRKLFWLKEQSPEIYGRTACMLQCKDYLAWCLTGGFATDYTDAATTGALDLREKTWSGEVTEGLGIDRRKLPKLLPSHGIVGRVTKEAQEEFGIRAGTPVVMGAGDNVCSAVGAGCVCPGDVYMSLGSSSWVAACTEEPVLDEGLLFSVFPHAVPGRYLSFVNYQTAGVVFKWLKNAVFQYDPEGCREVLPYKNVYPYTGMEALVEAADPGAGGLIFLPHLLSGDSSHRESFARGAYLGLSWEHTRADMVRAALEGVTFELRFFLEAVMGGRRPERLVVTGVASHERCWLQMLADVLGIPVCNTELHDTPDSVGAAVLAGYGIGIYENMDQADRFRKWEETFVPDSRRRLDYEALNGIYRKAFGAVSGIFRELENWREGRGKA